MSSDGALALPPLRTDGRIDLLTGLDAPEIFYKFLEKSIASVERLSMPREIFVENGLDSDAASGKTASADTSSMNPPSLLAIVRMRVDVDRLRSLREEHLQISPGLTSSQTSDSSLEASHRSHSARNELAYIEFALATIADCLRRTTRADESIVRIGEATFILLARFGVSDEILGMVDRLKSVLSDLDLLRKFNFSSVDSDAPVDGHVGAGVAVFSETDSQVKFVSRSPAGHSAADVISIDSFTYISGEGMLAFLERAEV